MSTGVDPIYDQVRDGLFDAAEQVHIPWSTVPTVTLQAIAAHLICYRKMFTLNYALLLYWDGQAEDVRSRVVDFLRVSACISVLRSPGDSAVLPCRLPVALRAVPGVGHALARIGSRLDCTPAAAG